jgi:hypothetical protein
MSEKIGGQTPPPKHRRRQLLHPRVLIGLGVSALALACLLAWTSQGRTVERIAIQSPRHIAAKSKSDATGDLRRLVSVDLYPDAVVTRAGRESVDYHAEVTNNRDTTIGLAWQVDVVDDHGKLVHPKVEVGSAKARAEELKTTRSFLADLSDGFYAIRVRVAATAANEPSDVVETNQYVQVVGGKWTELTDMEWRRFSRATLAYSEAEIAGDKQ